MKKRAVWFRVLMSLATTLLMAPLLGSRKAEAATCKNASNYGSVVVQLPPLAKTGEYAIWVRIQAADNTHNKVLVEINQTDCLTIGGTQATPKQWTWVAYSSDGTTAKAYNFVDANNNTAKIIGIETGVKIDKVMVAPLDCIPSGASDMCTTTSDKPTAQNMVETVQPTTNGPVSGEVYPTANILANANGTKSTAYSSDGKLIQTVQGAGKFDTTLVSNGKHTIAIKTTKVDGSTSEETTVIEVDNPETVLSPIMRIIRINSRTLLLASAVVLSSILIWLLWSLAKSHHHKKRYLDFHGL